MAFLKTILTAFGLAATPITPAHSTTSSQDLQTLQDRRSMSPNGRVWNWRVEPATPAQDDTHTPSLKRHLLTPDSAAPAKKRPKVNPEKAAYKPGKDKDDDDDDEFETVVAGESARRKAPSTWSEGDANQTTLVVSDGNGLTPTKKAQSIADQHAAEFARRKRQVNRLIDLGWPAADITLFTRIDMRGFEPLLPRHWEMDFRTIPTQLFTADVERQVIRSLEAGTGIQSDFRATNALQALMDVGPRVRDRIHSKLPPEKLLVDAVTAYIKWSLVDAGISQRKEGYLPVLRVVSATKDTPAASLQITMVKRWARLAAQWEAALARAGAASKAAKAKGKAASDAPPHPPLYGVVISHTIMAFVAYAPLAKDPVVKGADDKEQAAKKPLRALALFDFGDARYDVWNAFAVAILVCHCRTVILEHSAGREFVTRKTAEKDPDE